MATRIALPIRSNQRPKSNRYHFWSSATAAAGAGGETDIITFVTSHELISTFRNRHPNEASSSGFSAHWPNFIVLGPAPAGEVPAMVRGAREWNWHAAPTKSDRRK